MKEKILITCKEATNYISQKEEGKIKLRSRLELAIHFLICKYCKLFYKQNKFLIKNIQNLSTDASLTKEEQTKLSRVIEDSSIQ